MLRRNDGIHVVISSGTFGGVPMLGPTIKYNVNNTMTARRCGAVN